jgi:hypothetical protein
MNFKFYNTFYTIRRIYSSSFLEQNFLKQKSISGLIFRQKRPKNFAKSWQHWTAGSGGVSLLSTRRCKLNFPLLFLIMRCCTQRCTASYFLGAMPDFQPGWLKWWNLWKGGGGEEWKVWSERKHGETRFLVLLAEWVLRFWAQMPELRMEVLSWAASARAAGKGTPFQSSMTVQIMPPSPFRRWVRRRSGPVI